MFVARSSAGRVFRGIGRESVLVHGALVGLDAEPLRKQPHRATVGNAGGDMWPLARIGALREEAPELVEGRRGRAQDPVRVMVDERDRAQYFSK